MYRPLGRRKHTLFELLEAALGSSGPATLVHLSPAVVFRRRWPSASDALAAGQVDPARCRALIQQALDDPPGGVRPVWVGDGMIRARPRAQTSGERTWGHRGTPGVLRWHRPGLGVHYLAKQSAPPPCPRIRKAKGKGARRGYWAAASWLVSQARTSAGSLATFRLPQVRSNAWENVLTTERPDISMPKIVQPAAFTMCA